MAILQASDPAINALSPPSILLPRSVAHRASFPSRWSISAWALVRSGDGPQLAPGGTLFWLLQDSGQFDTVITILYVILLGWIGILMAKEAATALAIIKPSAKQQQKPARRHNPIIAALPMRWRFYQSGLYISPLAPLGLGFFAGMLTVLLGVGGGFIVVPAMIYLLGMSTSVVVGTSLFQILFVTAATTLIHATTTKSVDIVLAGLLLLSSVIGAQYGARFAQKAKPELLRMFLAIMVLGVALRMALELGWRPPEIYTVQPL